jgi:integrase
LNVRVSDRLTRRRVGDREYWSGRYWWADGTRRVVSLGACDTTGKTEARAALHRLASADPQTREVAPAHGVPTIDQWAVQIKAILADRDAKTLSDYACTLGLLAEHFGGSAPINTIDTAGANAWLMALRATGVTEWTVARHGRNARHAWRLATEHPTPEQPYIRASGFARARVPTPKHDPAWRYITLDETARAVVLAADLTQLASVCIPRLAGLRVEELASLSRQDIDTTRRRLTVRMRANRAGKGAGTKQRTRQVPIVPALWPLIDALLTRASDPLVPLPDKPQPAMHALWLAAGVEGVGKPFHDMRKSLETDWLDEYGFRAPAMLGNSPTVAVTFYHQLSERDLLGIAGLADPTAERRAASQRLAEAIVAAVARCANTMQTT